MSNPSASPAPVTINGKTYRMSPLTDRDIGEINNYIRSKYIKVARDSIEENTPPHLIDATIRTAMQEAQKLDWMRDPKLLNAPDVLIYMFWLSLKTETGVTQDEFAKDVFEDIDCLDTCLDTFMLIQPLMGNRKAAGTPKANPKASPKAGKKAKS